MSSDEIRSKAPIAAGSDSAPALVPDWPERIFAKFRELELRQIAYVPDAGHSRLIELCHADRNIKTTVLTTEEEGIGLLCGAWLGGERGALLMQSSGVGNCINTLSLAIACGFPMLMLVTMRGEWGEFNPWQVPMGQIASPTLRRSGTVVYELTMPDRAADTVEAAGRIAFYANRMAAVLISQQMLGTKLFKD
jgi:sulfopyruvate decarboxylase alpha subunit